MDSQDGCSSFVLAGVDAVLCCAACELLLLHEAVIKLFGPLLAGLTKVIEAFVKVAYPTLLVHFLGPFGLLLVKIANEECHFDIEVVNVLVICHTNVKYRPVGI